MNQRTKELMAQAGTDTSGKWMGVEHAEKFAELIIRECAKVVFEKTGPKSALNVLEHFGVEE